MLSHTLVLLLLLAGLVTAEFDIKIHKKYKELPFSKFVSYFNSLNLSYTIKEPSERHKLLSAKQVLNGRRSLMFPIEVHKPLRNLPKNFDSRKKWPRCDSISTINNQGDCDTCWVFGSVNTASDRTCIHKNISVHLSEAEATCFFNSQVCIGGGEPEVGFDFWLKHGLVTKQCQNYTTTKALGRCNTKCENHLIKYNKDKHFAKKIYRVASNSIREEIYKNGPVEASLKVFDDFEFYNSGIYEHKFGDTEGYHSVRIIGYGTEGGVDYWLVANSWGKTFGEKGFIRIKRDIGLGLEDEVFTGLPKN